MNFSISRWRTCLMPNFFRETETLESTQLVNMILRNKSNAQHGVNGVTVDVFVNEVFPQFPDLGRRLFNFLHMNSRAQTQYLGTIAFRQQCERFLGIMNDTTILENYVRIFAEEDRPDAITRQGVMNLLNTCFRVAMSHYPGNVKICNMMDRTFSAVINSIFFTQDLLSVGYVCRWFEQNCIRLIIIVHKFCVHTLSTAYRGLEQGFEQSFGLELATPVLEQTSPFPDRSNDEGLMPLSQAWLLAGALPTMYSKPQAIPTSGGNSSNSAQFLKDKMSLIPSHWTLIYDSNQHGVGANRFLHHVLGYRGPTLVLLHTKDDQTYCIASPSEWKETHLYIGGEESRVIQLLPKFVILEKGAKILYLNTSIRGYPKGLRAGSDPRKPVLSVDENFEKIDCKGIRADLLSIEVWGCGDKTSREVQLDIKKWQIKEAERQRTVKLTAADWMDHPDRYLLELGGRPNYNN
ncbi:uncharacterized protein LOC119653761 isoform X2 [Hermetia illucens]|uniref:uncharacterized protein LOC119653761 isoform X2 n=2 Tax=Hermetia illucens TaxID=343691 RepID=UPI0018CC3E17|nr:uncharacterized protein LOC119653761 isoform X2 [Hermetia illucens]